MTADRPAGDAQTIELACGLARRFEGCRLIPYRDACGYWTIGRGHLLGFDRTAPMPEIRWTQEQADAALDTDMAQFVAGVTRLFNSALPPQVTAALSDFAFNLGLRSLIASTLLRLTRAGDMPAAADQFARWKFAGGRVLPGLERRRAAERALFLS